MSVGNGANAVYSPTGSRGYVNIGLAEPFNKRSIASIAFSNSSAGEGGINRYRTWWSVEDFDMALPSAMYILPCEQSTFTLGEELYSAAEDAVPGAMRLKAKRCGHYNFTVDFPLIINNNPDLINVYNKVNTGVKWGHSVFAMSTSIQNRFYGCVLKDFSVSVDGYSGANPAKCKIDLWGLSQNINSDFTRRSITKMDTRRDKDTGRIYSQPLPRGSGSFFSTPSVTGADASKYGGRFINIKDCALTFNGVDYQQIVKMELKIEHEIKPLAVAKAEDSKVPTIRSVDRLFVRERKVTGSFTFLSSYLSGANFAAMNMRSNTLSELYSLASINAAGDPGPSQWASPLIMHFGHYMSFSMPAVYWQPRQEQLSTGSPLVTINFIARSNLLGISEFIEGLPLDSPQPSGI